MGPSLPGLTSYRQSTAWWGGLTQKERFQHHYPRDLEVISSLPEHWSSRIQSSLFLVTIIDYCHVHHDFITSVFQFLIFLSASLKVINVDFSSSVLIFHFNRLLFLHNILLLFISYLTVSRDQQYN